jgi:transketolase
MSPELATPLREVYRDHVVELMAQDDRLVCLDSDTGLFAGVDFADASERYINIGIAEQTLMGTAAGLAKAGFRPLVHTFAAFAASRALEAVKIDIALNALPVLICATHSGVSAGPLGPTHHALEDLGAMRSLPNMRVVVPADGEETRSLVTQALAADGPTYLRLGRSGTPPVEQAGPARLGEARVLREGRDILLVACGPYPVLAALEAADTLASEGVGATVLNVHTVKPLDSEALTAAAAANGGVVVAVEEHWGAGGLGSAVSEVLSETLGAKVHGVAMPDEFVAHAGDQAYLLEAAGITAGQVAARARGALLDARTGATA